jgi:outer membrane lipoprotein-sorting protein
MKKIILLALVCTGFAVTTPFTAQALDSEKISQNLDSHSERLRQREPNMSSIAQYRRNQNRERRFSVYYRSPRDRQWTFEGYHPNRQDAQRAANRLQRRGYRTYVQVSRRVYGGMNRG